MNIKEWHKACKEGLAPRRYDNASRKIQRSLKYNHDPNATVRHHLRDTEEQRKYNDEHYELWGFEIDENGNEHFEYGKYMIFVTEEEHLKIHESCEDTNKKRSKSLFGHPVSDETKRKLSIATRKSMTPIHRKHLSNIAKQNMSEERKKAIGLATKEAMKNPEIRKKISDSKTGKPLSDKHKEAISNGSKGRVVTKETRDKISKIHKGKFVSDETRKKLSLSNKALWEDEAYREKMRKAHEGKVPWNKGVPMSDEQKAKISVPFSEDHKKNLSKSMEKRTLAYYKYKEEHNDVKWSYFLKCIWPTIKEALND